MLPEMIVTQQVTMYPVSNFATSCQSIARQPHAVKPVAPATLQYQGVGGDAFKPSQGYRR